MNPDRITAIILCGGEGRRFAGADKPLLEPERLNGLSMIQRISEVVTPRVSNVLISANRHLDEYRAFGAVFKDNLEGFQGPLAGLRACLAHCETPWTFVLPGDTPYIESVLLDRLSSKATAEETADTDVFCAHDGLQRQCLHLFMRTTLRSGLSEYLSDGGRSVYRWLDGCRVEDVDCRDLAAMLKDIDEPSQLHAKR